MFPRTENWFPNPLLPDTKAETAVPIAIGDTVMGVLDVQQNRVDSLGQQDVDLLESIASQVAIALQNAQLFSEAQRAEAEAVKFKLGIERSDNGIFLTNVAGVIEYVNPAFEELYGYTAAEAIGQTPRILKSGQTPPEQYKAIWQDMLAGRTVSGEIVNKTKDGRLVHIDRSNNPIINQDNELIGFLSVNTDISARIQAEETLIRRATELATVAEVGTITATILEPKQLLQQVVDLTKTNFGLYHAHIHLLNDNQDTLVLTAGAGKVGQQMVAEGRRIPLAAKNSLVATVARTKQGSIRNYDPPGEGFMPHPLLAETRCEMAVPMALGEDVLGVLDVRSDKLNHFSTTDMQTYTTLAAQIAVALQNARSFARSEQALKEMAELSRRLTREGWESYMDTAVADLHYAYGTLPDDNKDAAEAENRLSLPLRIQGATIGQLTLTEPQAMTDEAATIVDEVAERLSAHIETLRLATQTEQALAGTEALYRGSDRVVRATTAAGVVQALVESTLLSRFCQTTLFLFNQPWRSTPPQTMTAVATLQQGKLLSAGDEVGMQMPLNEFPDAEFLKRDEPFLVADLMHDGRFDEETIALMEHGRPNLRSTVAFPLVAGDDWFGILTAVHVHPYKLGKKKLRQITSLTDQAATVIRNLQLIEQTIRRAQEEQIVARSDSPYWSGRGCRIYSAHCCRRNRPGAGTGRLSCFGWRLQQRAQGNKDRTMIMESALETAVADLGIALQAQHTQVELSMSTNENRNSAARRTDVAAQGTQNL